VNLLDHYRTHREHPLPVGAADKIEAILKAAEAREA